MYRACVLEFAVEDEAEINLARAVRLIDAALRQERVELLVLPAGLDAGAAFEYEASPVLQGLARKAREHGIHLVAGLGTPGAQSERVVLLGPAGDLLGQALAAPAAEDLATYDVTVIDTGVGRVAICTGDALTRFETARLSALEGAEILCASYGAGQLSIDDAHPSARALENAMHILCAAARPSLSKGTFALPHSRIITAEGIAAGQAHADSETIVIASLEPAARGAADRMSPLSLRRPELYRGLSAPFAATPNTGAPRRVAVAGWALAEPFADDALERAAQAVGVLAREGVALVVVPALTGFPSGSADDPEAAATRFQAVARRLAEACAGTPTHVVTTVIERRGSGLVHTGVVLGHAGVVARRMPSHASSAFHWSELGRRGEPIALPWGKLAIALPDELYVPELGALWARAGVELVAVPEHCADPALLAALARQWAREHGLSVVVATSQGACVESATLAAELDLSGIINDDLRWRLAARRLRLGGADSAAGRRSAALPASMRALWVAPRLAPSLAEAIMVQALEAEAVIMQEAVVVDDVEPAASGGDAPDAQVPAGPSADEAGEG
jgi:predicted amidohydrolase